MLNVLRVSVRFLDPAPTFHGKRDGGESEWPASPLRLFQALLDAAASRWRELQFNAYASPALKWLEQLRPREILAPPHHVGTPFRIAVPNNDLDVWAGPIAKGKEPKKQPSELKTMKTVQPIRIRAGDGERGETLQYLYPLPPDGCPHLEVLKSAARSVTHLGWGIDMVAADADIISEADAAELPGIRWRLAPVGGVPLRVPKPGTLDDLIRKRAAFLGRLSNEGFKPVAPLSVFAVVGYRRPTDSVPLPFIAFKLRTPDFEQFQPYAPTRYTCAVAGMVRNALAGLAKVTRPLGWTDAQINTFVHGHTGDGEAQAHGPGADRRFAYLPLPSLERRATEAVVVTAIRRVLVVGPPGGDREIAWARVLSGRELVPTNDRTPPAALQLIDGSAAALCTDPNLRPYVGEARVWSTVTPVVLPGHDEADSRTIARRLRMAGDAKGQRRVLDQAAARTKRLLRRAFEQAGMPPELVRVATLEWRLVGFRAGVDLATRYHRPEPCRLPRYHVRVRWPVPVRGPLAVGAARYRGLGIFAAE